MLVGTFNKMRTLLCIHHIIDVKIEEAILTSPHNIPTAQYLMCMH